MNKTNKKLFQVLILTGLLAARSRVVPEELQSNEYDVLMETADKLDNMKLALHKYIMYRLSKLKPPFSEDVLFNIKFNIMGQMRSIAKQEKMKNGGKSPQWIEDINYRISFMGEKQLYEIIDILKENIKLSNGTQQEKELFR
jgi:hypothetical protein